MQQIDIIRQRLEQRGAWRRYRTLAHALGVGLILLFAVYLAGTALYRAAYLPLLPPLTADFALGMDPTNPRHGQTFTVTEGRVDRVDVVLRVPEAAGEVPVVVRLWSDGPDGTLLMERRAYLRGSGSWQAYAFALPGTLPAGIRKLYFELENEAAHTTVMESRVSKWDRLPDGELHVRRMVEWADQDMVLQAYARPQLSALRSRPAVIAEYVFPTAAGPFLLLEVIAVLGILAVFGNHALQQQLPLKPSWQLRYATDALLVALLIWWVLGFLLGGTYGTPSHWV